VGRSQPAVPDRASRVNTPEHEVSYLQANRRLTGSRRPPNRRAATAPGLRIGIDIGRARGILST